MATVRTSPIHGSGLFALRDLLPGRRIGVYEGRRYEPNADREWDPGLIYIFRLSDGSSIDGFDGGNDLRHINHSCELNCAAFEVEQKDGSIAIVIETVRSVQSDEELFWTTHSMSLTPTNETSRAAAAPRSVGERWSRSDAESHLVRRT